MEMLTCPLCADRALILWPQHRCQCGTRHGFFDLEIRPGADRTQVELRLRHASSGLEFNLGPFPADEWRALAVKAGVGETA